MSVLMDARVREMQRCSRSLRRIAFAAGVGMVATGVATMFSA